MTGRLNALLAGLALAGTIAALAIADPLPQRADSMIASTDEAEVCKNDGLPGSAYSRAHRVVARKPVPGFQLDHKVNLALGGADNDENIWLQALDGPWNAHDKDRLEKELSIRVCRLHTMGLREAQSMIWPHWREAYVEVFGERPRSTIQRRD